MIEIAEDFGADDYGSYSVIVNGVPLPGRFWRREGAEAAADDFLWRSMVLG